MFVKGGHVDSSAVQSAIFKQLNNGAQGRKRRIVCESLSFMSIDSFPIVANTDVVSLIS